MVRDYKSPPIEDQGIMRKFLRTKDPCDRERYSREKAKYKRVIKAAKTRSWREFCSSEGKLYGSVFNIIKEKGRDSRPYLTTLVGMPADCGSDDILRALIKHHFSITDYYGGEPVRIPLESYEPINL